jgi:putative nucleotidyltransferase with HDIG domain
MTPTLHYIAGGIPKLASYAAVLQKLEALLSDMNATMVDIGAVIEKDPALAAKLLKLGNSSFFSFSRRVETVFETVSLIGIQQVHDLIGAAVVMRVFEGVSPELISMESFWRHSLACGVAARILATSRSLPNPDRHFTAGLLHDIGRLNLVSRFADVTRTIFDTRAKSKLLLRDAERCVLGFDHADIGAAMLESWHYPASLVQAVQFHHTPMSAGTFQMEASVIHVADHLVNAMKLGSSGERWIPPLDAKAWDRLNVPVASLESVLASIDQQTTVVEEVFLAQPV